MCFVNIYIQYSLAKNTDFRILQKSSKHFLISIFFPLGQGDTPSLSHPLYVLRVSNNEYLFLTMFS